MSAETHSTDVKFRRNARAEIPIDDKPRLCAKHEKEARMKNGDGDTAKVTLKKPTANKENFFQKLFGKGSLERKLDYHGIKLKVTFRHRRQIHPTDGESPDDKKFLVSELRYFSASQLSVIIETFNSKIDILTKEHKEVNEENERLADDQKGLELTARNLEDIALRVMKPWVNIMPHSDEMTRVMLLN